MLEARIRAIYRHCRPDLVHRAAEFMNAHSNDLWAYYTLLCDTYKVDRDAEWLPTDVSPPVPTEVESDGTTDSPSDLGEPCIDDVDEGGGDLLPPSTTANLVNENMFPELAVERADEVLAELAADEARARVLAASASEDKAEADTGTAAHDKEAKAPSEADAGATAHDDEAKAPPEADAGAAAHDDEAKAPPEADAGATAHDEEANALPGADAGPASDDKTDDEGDEKADAGPASDKNDDEGDEPNPDWGSQSEESMSENSWSRGPPSDRAASDCGQRGEFPWDSTDDEYEPPPLEPLLEGIASPANLGIKGKFADFAGIPMEHLHLIMRVIKVKFGFLEANPEVFLDYTRTAHNQLVQVGIYIEVTSLRDMLYSVRYCLQNAFRRRKDILRTIQEKRGLLDDQLADYILTDDERAEYMKEHRNNFENSEVQRRFCQLDCEGGVTKKRDREKRLNNRYNSYLAVHYGGRKFIGAFVQVGPAGIDNVAGTEMVVRERIYKEAEQGNVQRKPVPDMKPRPRRRVKLTTEKAARKRTRYFTQLAEDMMNPTSERAQQRQTKLMAQPVPDSDPHQNWTGHQLARAFRMNRAKAESDRQAQAEAKRRAYDSDFQ